MFLLCRQLCLPSVQMHESVFIPLVFDIIMLASSCFVMTFDLTTMKGDCLKPVSGLTAQMGAARKTAKSEQPSLGVLKVGKRSY